MEIDYNVLPVYCGGISLFFFGEDMKHFPPGALRIIFCWRKGSLLDVYVALIKNTAKSPRQCPFRIRD